MFAQVCVDEAHEGVMVKRPMSKYALGRRGKDWLKWKSDYISQFSGTFDVLIVGGSWGYVFVERGKRRRHRQGRRRGRRTDGGGRDAGVPPVASEAQPATSEAHPTRQ